jgi:hypothetical protein
MKITKALLKQIIQEEVQKVILEQETILSKAGREAAERKERERRMAARGKEIEDLEYLNKDAFAPMTGLADKMAGMSPDEIAFASADRAMEFEPEDIVVKKPRRGSNDVRQLQKAVGARQDGIPGPKTYGRFMKKANLKPSQLSYKQFMNLLRGASAPAVIAGMIEMLGTKTPGMLGQAMKAALGGADSLPMDKAVDTAVEAPSKGELIQALLGGLAESGVDVPTSTVASQILTDLEGEAFKKEYMRQLDKVTLPNYKRSLMRKLRKADL